MRCRKFALPEKWTKFSKNADDLLRNSAPHRAKFHRDWLNGVPEKALQQFNSHRILATQGDPWAKVNQSWPWCTARFLYQSAKFRRFRSRRDWQKTVNDVSLRTTNIHPIILASFLFTAEKILTVTTPKYSQNVRTSINQEERRRDTTIAHTISVQSVMSSVASNKWLTLHQFDTCRSRNRGYWGVLERCNPWSHVANRHVSIRQLLSTCCYLFTVSNSGLLSVHRPRPAGRR